MASSAKTLALLFLSVYSACAADRAALDVLTPAPSDLGVPQQHDVGSGRRMADAAQESEQRTKFAATGMPTTPNQWPLEGKSPRDAADVAARSAWGADCAGYKRPRSREELAGVSTAGMLTDRAKLKAHAFHIFARTEHLRNKLPPANHSFNPGGPWIENWWVNTFARPITRRVTLAEVAQLRDAAVQLDAEQKTWTTPPWDAGLGSATAAVPVPADADKQWLSVTEPFDFELFYPFVPLFINFEDVAFWTIKREGQDVGVAAVIGNTLLPLLRPDVVYITVVQRTMGPIVRDFPQFEALASRIIMLGAGGRTQIPIPLLAREIAVQPHIPWAEKKYSISFLGNRRPGTRERCVLATLKELGNVTFLEANVQGEVNSAQRQWTSMMSNSILQLAPRGTGPTSFRLYEALQLGGIPVYVWEHALWLPYLDYWDPAPERGVDLWRSIGFTVHVDQYESWLQNHYTAIVRDAALLDSMRSAILAARDQYFTYDAIMWHIYKLLLDPWTADLKCVPYA